MRIAICDDLETEQKNLLKALQACEPNQQAECFFTGQELLAAAKEKPPFDIVFLDIYLENESGVDVAWKLKECTRDTGIVFVTTSPSFAAEAYSLDALHYLVKPVTQQGVKESLYRYRRLKGRERPIIHLTVGRNAYNVYIDEIAYVLSLNHAKEIHLVGGREIKVWMPMEELQENLGKNFLKLNRSTLVNMEQIEQMGREACVMRGGTRLEIARRNRAAIQAAYEDYVFSRLKSRVGGVLNSGI